MVAHTKNLTTVIVVVAVVTSGFAGMTIGAAETGTTPSDSASGAGPGDGSVQDDGFETELECAATPPGDLSDPDSDAMGWENGYWYAESLDVDRSDGMQGDELETVVARTMARVEAIRCIEFEESVPVSVISREEFRRAELERNASEDLRAFDNAKFEALFLIDESADSIEVQRENRGTGVLGYYSPENDEIVVVAESAETLRVDEITLAHELIHAWQDQQFGLRENPLNASLRDEVNARNGIVEGDASYVDTLYGRQCAADWDCLEGRSGDRGELANIGVYLLKFQPYSDGPAFVRMVRNLGGWDAVNALYENPPESTEQVIHPQKYGADPPTNVSLEDAATEEWERVRLPDRPDYGSVGESALMAMFVYPYYHSEGETEIVPPAQWFNQNETGAISDFDPLSYESQYSTGWDGDRLHVYRNDADELAYVWRLEWDSPQDAQQFAEGYREVLDYWGANEVGTDTYRIDEGGFADAFHVEVDGTTVTVTNAPTVEQLSEVRTDVVVTATGNGTETVATEAAATETAADETTAIETDEPAASATVEVEANETTATA